jgi:hypothetical protein
MTDDRPHAAEREARFARLMRRIAIAVLAVGLSAAAVVFALAPAEGTGSEADAAAAAIQDSRQYEQAMERIGGKAVVFAAEFNDWLASLWHGRRLAATLAVISVAVAWLCYLASRPPP